MINVNKSLVYTLKCCLFVKKPTKSYKNRAASVDKIVWPVIICMRKLFAKKYIDCVLLDKWIVLRDNYYEKNRQGRIGMYKRESGGWLKHYDFLLLDMICLQIAFLLSFVVLGRWVNPYSHILYRKMALYLEVADVAVVFFFGTFSDVLKKGYYRNFVTTVQHAAIVFGLSVLYLFLSKEGQLYSRLSLTITFILYVFITYAVRELRKRQMRKQMENGIKESLFIVTTGDVAGQVVDKMMKNNYARYRMAGMAVIDTEAVGQTINGVDVVADASTAVDYVCQNWVDEVLIVISDSQPYPKKLIDQLTETGVTVHLNLAKTLNMSGKKQFVEQIGPYTVLTTTMNYASARQLLVKRVMDIAGGLVGCLLTGIIFIFVAPAIYISSPGPIFFAQERVGKNGKTFKMYKFRSMYMDAEARKAELMKDNKLGDGKMFKMDFDPRVIGNKILPDGTKKTGIGDFIRRTSLDEFPQFFNVLKGDMSIVGTRPPLVSETELYEPHHFARLTIKPGITGLWQVSGRSDITDFEEVVRLDTEYIDNWNVGMDIKILLKTVAVVLKKDGSM